MSADLRSSVEAACAEPAANTATAAAPANNPLLMWSPPCVGPKSGVSFRPCQPGLGGPLARPPSLADGLPMHRKGVAPGVEERFLEDGEG
ncbi:hypothetical protein KH5H1_04080 [Corallococcus caeni]|nr:hypothetical protein KH5H1_04080 [Corallococcus sp. KH5-1]